MAYIQPRFGYVLQAATTFASAEGWANNTSNRIFYRISPRYSLPLAGIAVYLTQVGSGQADAYLYHDIAGPVWSSSDYLAFLLNGGGVNRVALPASPGRFAITGLNFPLRAGCGYWLGIRHTSTGSVMFFPGFDRRVSDWSQHGYQESCVLFYTGSLSVRHGQFNAQILYQMPDGTVKTFEPLLTGSYNDEYTTSNLAVRFTVPNGLNLNVDGVVLAHFTKQGSPGGLKVTLKQGTTTILDSDPLTTLFTPPSTTAGLSFYIPFLGSAVLSGGSTYDLNITVSGTHDASNRFAMKVVGVDTTVVPDWWTYRMVIGGTEYQNKVPTMFLLSLDVDNPFG